MLSTPPTEPTLTWLLWLIMFPLLSKAVLKALEELLHLLLHGEVSSPCSTIRDSPRDSHLWASSTLACTRLLPPTQAKHSTMSPMATQLVLPMVAAVQPVSPPLRVGTQPLALALLSGLVLSSICLFNFVKSVNTMLPEYSVSLTRRSRWIAWLVCQGSSRARVLFVVNIMRELRFLSAWCIFDRDLINEFMCPKIRFF
jgi:hypothetical protein